MAVSFSWREYRKKRRGEFVKNHREYLKPLSERHGDKLQKSQLKIKKKSPRMHVSFESLGNHEKRTIGCGGLS